MKKLVIYMILTFFFFAPLDSFGKRKKKRSPRRVPSGFVEERKTKLNMRGGVVDGITQKRSRFGSEIQKRRKKKRAHLYNEYISFDEEMNQTLREMRDTK